MAGVITIGDVGWRAEAALRRAPGAIRVLAALSASTYLTIDGEIVWLGPVGSALHPRAMLTADPLPAGGRPRFTLQGARRWRAPALPEGPHVEAALHAGARALAEDAPGIGDPDGFGPLLVGRVPAFPLDGAAPGAIALARACADDDPDAAVRAASPLIGLGPGLTPAGDDYVGGAFFARALIAGRSGRGVDAWRQAASRTHPISAALLGDMLDGEGHAPLHELALRLASGRSRGDALDAARRLTRIGHSSGWDMLAGFLAGLGRISNP